MALKTVRVVAAVITDGGMIFATQRGYDYPSFHLSMDCFWATVRSGHLELKEAEDAKWLGADELDSVRWLPADLELVERMKYKLLIRSRDLRYMTD